jgi:hypothetical protein
MQTEYETPLEKILLDTTFKLSALSYNRGNATLNIADALDKLKETGDILKFYNLTIQRVKDNAGESFLEFTGIDFHNQEINIAIDKRSIHPLEKEYGTDGLKLEKIVYREKTKSGDLSYYFVEYAVFNIVKENKKLKLTARELYRYIISMKYSFGVSISEKFYRQSGLNYFNILSGLVVFVVKTSNLHKLYWKMAVEQSENQDAQWNKWKNKIMISGQDVKCDGVKLDKYLGNCTTLVIPNILFVSGTAFISSNIKELVLSSPETIIDESYEFGIQKMYNSNGKAVKVTKAYDKDLNKPLIYNEPMNILSACMLHQASFPFNIDIISCLSLTLKSFNDLAKLRYNINDTAT